LERMAVKDEEPDNTMSTMRISNPALDIIEKEDRLNQTVTCAEPSSPCREAAKGAAGWQKFHGRSTGRSVSVHLTKEEAAFIRERRQQQQQRGTTPSLTTLDNDDVDEASVNIPEKRASFLEEEPAPPLPPKPKQKISVMGSPNTDQFIVMDNSALFARQKAEAATAAAVPGQTMMGKQLGDCHSRSDSGLSSLGSWNNVTGGGYKSGSSSVRSSSIVSDCSSKLEELLEDQNNKNNNTTFLSMCSLKLENLIEQDELVTPEKREITTTASKSDDINELLKDPNSGSNLKDHAEDENRKNVDDDYDYDDVCQSSTVSGVQRQLETIKHQKEMLIKDIVQNEELGRGVTHKLEV